MSKHWEALPRGKKSRTNKLRFDPNMSFVRNWIEIMSNKSDDDMEVSCSTRAKVIGNQIWCRSYFKSVIVLMLCSFTYIFLKKPIEMWETFFWFEVFKYIERGWCFLISRKHYETLWWRRKTLCNSGLIIISDAILPVDEGDFLNHINYLCLVFVLFQLILDLSQYSRHYFLVITILFITIIYYI